MTICESNYGILNKASFQSTLMGRVRKEKDVEVKAIMEHLAMARELRRIQLKWMRAHGNKPWTDRVIDKKGTKYESEFIMVLRSNLEFHERGYL